MWFWLDYFLLKIKYRDNVYILLDYSVITDPETKESSIISLKNYLTIAKDTFPMEIH